MCWGTTQTLHVLHYVFVCVCVYVPEYVDLFKAGSSGDFGIHLLLMCYQHASFSNGAASDIVHKPASASLKSPLSQNSSGPLYLTDAQESLSHRGNTSQSATATDSGINEDGHPSSRAIRLGACRLVSLCVCVCVWREIRANPFGRRASRPVASQVCKSCSVSLAADNRLQLIYVAFAELDAANS